MNPTSLKLASLVAAACLLGSSAAFADTGINKLFEAPKKYDSPLKTAQLVAAAMFTFDTLDTAEKLLLVMAADAKLQVDLAEQQLQTHAQDVTGRGEERAAKRALVLLKRRQLAGMPMTMRELKEFISPRVSQYEPFIHGPYNPTKSEVRELWNAFDTVLAEPNFRSKAAKQYEAGSFVDPFGLPFGPFAFNQPIQVSAETKAAFKAAAKAINWQDEHVPEPLRKIGRGLVDETFWGAFR